MMEIFAILSSIVILIVVSVLIWIKRQYNFWSKQGVECGKYTYFFGDITDIIKQKISAAELTCRLYNNFKQRNLKYGGCYFLFWPLFLPVDPDLVKKIMVKDFDHFVDRGIYYDEKNDPLTAHLFSLEGRKWKNLRAKLTPTFTSGKMKMMFSTIVDCTKNLIFEVDKLCTSSGPIDMKDILARFNTDVIASVAFGLDTNSISNPHSEFHQKGDKVFAPGAMRQILQLMMIVMPSVTKFLKLKMLSPDVSDFYFRVITDTKFDPERFSEENKRKRHPYAYLPFGEGPRICIGMRFGLMQTKIGIASLMKNYRVRVNPKTKQPITFDIKSFILKTQGGVWLDLEKLQ